MHKELSNRIVKKELSNRSLKGTLKYKLKSHFGTEMSKGTLKSKCKRNFKIIYLKEQKIEIVQSLKNRFVQRIFYIETQKELLNLVFKGTLK